jgi:hypothetical protein
MWRGYIGITKDLGMQHSKNVRECTKTAQCTKYAQINMDDKLNKILDGITAITKTGLRRNITITKRG